MENAIIIGIVALILTGAIVYIVKQKKSGAKCVGCPSSKQCGSCSSCKSHAK